MDASPPPRPTSVTLVAIFGLAFGVLGMCVQPLSLLAYFVDTGSNPVMDIIRANTAVFLTLLSMGVLSVLLTVIEIVGCVGLLLMKPWSRGVVLFYAGASVLLQVSSTIFNSIFLLPELISLGDPAAVGAAVGSVIGGCAGSLIPAAFLFVLTRPAVVHAYRGEV